MHRILPMLLALFFLGVPLSYATRGVTSEEANLHAKGRKTILSIANGDFAYISSITDPQGVYVGYDEMKHSMASFQSDLLNHVGLYCELFERGCKTNHNPDYTLGHVLKSAGTYPMLSLKFKVNGNNGTVEYWEFRGDGDLIATLSYRLAGGKWYLCNIHYV
jgi:hypothetical protein